MFGVFFNDFSGWWIQGCTKNSTIMKCEKSPTHILVPKIIPKASKGNPRGSKRSSSVCFRHSFSGMSFYWLLLLWPQITSEWKHFGPEYVKKGGKRMPWAPITGHDTPGQLDVWVPAPPQRAQIPNYAKTQHKASILGNFGSLVTPFLVHFGGKMDQTWPTCPLWSPMASLGLPMGSP